LKVDTACGSATVVAKKGYPWDGTCVTELLRLNFLGKARLEP